MDVDVQSETVGSISRFSISPESFPWREPRPHLIETRRAQLCDSLIFDILLTSGGIREPDLLYPPVDVDSLVRLLEAIENSTYDVLKKNCLVYFLLKWHQDGREDIFRDEKCIPPQFAALADAYWHLDTGINVERAVSILADSRLNRDYASKILQALALSENSTPLILKYVRTAKPLLIEPDDLDAYITALTESSLLAAWQFQRSFAENGESRSRLVKKILEWCLSPKPRPQPLKQLMAFPFNDYEQALFHEYALHPPTTCPKASVPVIQDLVCVRLIQSGQYASAVKLDRQISLATTNATGRAKNAMLDRRQMMNEIIAGMVVTERNLLELELDQMSKGSTRQPLSASGSADSFISVTGTDDLSMSWEHVSPPRPAINGYSIPSRSHAQERPTVNGTAPPFIPINKNLFPSPANQSRQPAFMTSVSQPLSSSLTPSRNPLRAPVSAASPAGLKYPLVSTVHGMFTTPTTTSAPVIPALFSSIGGSNARNAFYEPPRVNGVKRLFGQDEPRPQPEPVRIPDQRPPNHDHRANADPEADVVNHHETDDRQTDDGIDTAPDQLSFSIFSHPDESIAPKRRIARTETQQKMPPGAFFSDDEEEKEEEEMIQYNTRSRVMPPAQKLKQTRSSHSQLATKVSDEGRRLPGALIEDEEEELDRVPPLPSPTLKRPVRKGRSRANNHDDNGGMSIAPRRSSRLSATPSRASSSPEPLIKKAPPRKSTRKPTTTSTKAPSKSSTRKKR